MTSLPVFLTEQLPSEGVETILDGPQGRHAATVRRLRAGERLTLTDGHGELALCEVLDTGRDLHTDRTTAAHPPVAAALGAWVADDRADTPAARAWPRGHHLTEERPRDVAHLTAAAA